MGRPSDKFLLTGRWLTVLFVAALLGAAGCTTDAPAPAKPSGSPIYQGDELPALTIEPVRLPKSLLVRAVFDRATVIDDLLIVAGRDRSDYGAVAAVDLDSGKVRWQGNKIRDEISTNRGVLDIFSSDGWALETDDGGLVFEEYYRNPCPGRAGICDAGSTTYTEEFGLVAFSADKREVRWAVPTIPRRKNSGKATDVRSPHTVGVSSSVVVVNIGGDPIHGTAMADSSAMRTIGLDPQTGKRPWTIDDTLTQVVTDDLVLAAKQMPGNGGRLQALDPRTGDLRWEVAGQPGQWDVAGDDLAVAVSNVPGEKSRLVALRDGSVRAEMARASVAIGTANGSEYAAWVSFDADNDSPYRLQSREIDDPRPVDAEEPMNDYVSVSGATNGYVWLHQDNGVFAVDRSGEKRSQVLDGLPRMITDEWIVTDKGGREGSISVWRYRRS